jgi:hypothetical protein
MELMCVRGCLCRIDYAYDGCKCPRTIMLPKPDFDLAALTDDDEKKKTIYKAKAIDLKSKGTGRVVQWHGYHVKGCRQGSRALSLITLKLQLDSIWKSARTESGDRTFTVMVVIDGMKQRYDTDDLKSVLRMLDDWESYARSFVAQVVVFNHAQDTIDCVKQTKKVPLISWEGLIRRFESSV